MDGGSCKLFRDCAWGGCSFGDDLLTMPHRTLTESALERLATLAHELGASDLEAEARGALARLTEQRFFVACVGQFKRGKSTLLNALVGLDVLPVGIQPVTSALTVLRYGPEARAEVRFRQGGTAAIEVSELAEYVDERRNPENAKDVALVEVFVPAPLLAPGLCLVDTPGLGSVFAGNTAVTRAFVPQIDAALVVLGSDPPITGEEADLVLRVAAQADHLVVVLNKADRAPASELQEARRFTEQVIQDRLGKPLARLLDVSARERIEQGVATRDWSALEDRLCALARESRTEILASAGTRATARLVRALRAEIDQREAALRRPLQATEARVLRLRRAVRDGERSLVELGALFVATEADLARRFDAQRVAFANGALPEAVQELAEAITAEAAVGASLRAFALVRAREIAERHVRAFLVQAEPAGGELYSHATERFVALANTFLAEVVSQGGEAGPALVVEPGFQKPRGFYFTSMMSHTRVGLLTWLADVLRVACVRRVTGHANRYLGELLYANSMRVAADLRDRVLESRRSLEAQVKQRLIEALGAGERALSNAKARHAAGSAAVTGDLERLAAQRSEVEASVTVRG